MIIADTSAWVEYDRATGSPADVRVAQLIATGDELAVSEPIVMEICASARTDWQERELRRLLLGRRLVPFDPAADFDGAIRVYRQCRSVGVTPRGLIDCMIAAITWRTGATLLAHDVDLDRIARVLDVPTDEASLRAG